MKATMTVCFIFDGVSYYYRIEIEAITLPIGLTKYKFISVLAEEQNIDDDVLLSSRSHRCSFSQTIARERSSRYF